MVPDTKPVGKGREAAGIVHWRRWNVYLAVAGALHFALFYTLNTRPMLDMAQFEEGRGAAPFQYRLLTAWLFGAADRTLHIPAALQRHLPPSMSSVDDFAMVGLVFVSLLAAMFAVFCALRRLTGDGKAWSRWGALLVLPMCYYHYLLEFGHPCCTPLQLPYDLPSVAFFATAFALIVAGRTTWLYPLLALATLNRESSVFLVVLFTLYRTAETRWRDMRVWLHAAGLLAVWFAMRALTHHMVHPPPRTDLYGGFEIHSVDNVGYLLKPYYWTSFLSLFGFTLPFVYVHWREVPGAGMRRALWIGPIYLGAMYVVGVLSEIRVFGELIGVYAVAFVLLMRVLAGKSTELAHEPFA